MQPIINQNVANFTTMIPKATTPRIRPEIRRVLSSKKKLLAYRITYTGEVSRGSRPDHR
jgi:hypothetical protein